MGIIGRCFHLNVIKATRFDPIYPLRSSVRYESGLLSTKAVAVIVNFRPSDSQEGTKDEKRIGKTLRGDGKLHRGAGRKVACLTNSDSLLFPLHLGRDIEIDPDIVLIPKIDIRVEV